MAVETAIELFIAADQVLRVDVTDGAATPAPQTMTGWALAAVVRSTDGALVVNTSTGGNGITIGDGSGTNDRATITLTDTDMTGWPPGRAYEWALWRTDAGTDIPLAYGQCTLKRVAAQV